MRTTRMRTRCSFLALRDPFCDSGGQVIVLQIVEVLEDRLPGIKGLGAPGLFLELFKALFNIGGQSGGKHDSLLKCYTNIAKACRGARQVPVREELEFEFAIFTSIMWRSSSKTSLYSLIEPDKCCIAQNYA